MDSNSSFCDKYLNIYTWREPCDLSLCTKNRFVPARFRPNRNYLFLESC